MERRKRFAKVMAALGEVFPHEDVTSTRAEVFYKALEDLPIEKIEENAWWHIQNRKFFPKPCELRYKGGEPTGANYHQIAPLYSEIARGGGMKKIGAELEKIKDSIRTGKRKEEDSPE